MFTEELLEESRRSADRAKQNLAHITGQPTGITGGGSAAGHTVTRTAMRKNADHISNSVHIDKVLALIAQAGGKSSEQYGVIPHPLAWDLCFDGKTVFAHTVDGPEVECAFDEPETNGSRTCRVHRLSVDGNVLIDKKTEIVLPAVRNQILIPVITAIVVILFFAAVIIASLL